MGRERGRDLSHLPTGWYVHGIEFPDEQPELDPEEERLSEQIRSGEFLKLLHENSQENKSDI